MPNSFIHHELSQFHWQIKGKQNSSTDNKERACQPPWQNVINKETSSSSLLTELHVEGLIQYQMDLDKTWLI